MTDGVNIRPDTVIDADYRPFRLFITAGQVRHDTGTAALLSSLPSAECSPADRSRDADRFRDALNDTGISPCSPCRKSRGKPIRHDRRRHRRRGRIEITFGRLKDRRCVAMRYDRCPKVLLSAALRRALC